MSFILILITGLSILDGFLIGFILGAEFYKKYIAKS